MSRFERDCKRILRLLHQLDPKSAEFFTARVALIASGLGARVALEQLEARAVALAGEKLAEELELRAAPRAPLALPTGRGEAGEHG